MPIFPTIFNSRDTIREINNIGRHENRKEWKAYLESLANYSEEEDDNEEYNDNEEADDGCEEVEGDEEEAIQEEEEAVIEEETVEVESEDLAFVRSALEKLFWQDCFDEGKPRGLFQNYPDKESLRRAYYTGML
ncbi:hypothetical protein BD770DRAFT_447714 [Pilaira anomala]|nr:hypothetical protein BD770DRAFT_447714 [Pilaira anomala]